ncbi:MAG: hypothetical protein HC866_21705 [Leptolyngbyaceae cyanobacterium RU_5_1]|nr:hypothetical protein [Leptolyngbyaceae cyanobacterium RU_5_1]
MSDYRVLVARLRNELTRLDTVVQTATNQTEKATQTGDVDYFQAAALSLQNFYMGVERIFEEIAKQIDQSVPTGANSHRELLEQMALEISSLRPPVIQADTLKSLNEYRGFRHVVIHRYGFELYPERIRELVEALPNSYVLLSRDTENFCQFLLELERSL